MEHLLMLELLQEEQGHHKDQLHKHRQEQEDLAAAVVELK